MSINPIGRAAASIGMGSPVALKESMGARMLAGLHQLAERADDLTKQLESEFGPVLERPRMATECGPDCEEAEPTLPDYFAELRVVTNQLSHTLDRIESVISRSRL